MFVLAPLIFCLFIWSFFSLLFRMVESCKSEFTLYVFLNLFEIRLWAELLKTVLVIEILLHACRFSGLRCTFYRLLRLKLYLITPQKGSHNWFAQCKRLQHSTWSTWQSPNHPGMLDRLRAEEDTRYFCLKKTYSNLKLNPYMELSSDALY